MPTFRISTHKNKKYDVYLEDIGKWISFGDSRYRHYKTSNIIPQNLHIYPEHRNKERRNNYRKRASYIKDINGNFTYKNPHSANYWAFNYLW